MRQAHSHTTSPLAAQHGVALLEALIAILLISIALLGLIGLQARMLKATEEARYRIEATSAAQQHIAQMWAEPTATIGTKLGNNLTLDTYLPAGKLSAKKCTSGVPDCYEVTVSWKEPSNGETYNVTMVAHVNKS